MITYLNKSGINPQAFAKTSLSLYRTIQNMSMETSFSSVQITPSLPCTSATLSCQERLLLLLAEVTGYWYPDLISQYSHKPGTWTNLLPQLWSGTQPSSGSSMRHRWKRQWAKFQPRALHWQLSIIYMHYHFRPKITPNLASHATNLTFGSKKYEGILYSTNLRINCDQVCRERQVHITISISLTQLCC